MNAVGLQIDTHLQVVGLHLSHPLLGLLHLGQDAKLVLHVVADLVRNHVGLGELAGPAADVAGTEPPLEILKEIVEVNFLVKGAIEGPIADCANPQPDRVDSENMTSVGGWYFFFPACAKMSVHSASVLPRIAATNRPEPTPIPPLRIGRSVGAQKKWQVIESGDIGHHIALGLPLQRVVPDGRGGLQGLKTGSVSNCNTYDAPRP